MRVYESHDIRNTAVVGHGHSGKTTLTAALLYTAGATARLTRVDDGSTPTDFDEEEIQRKLSISTAIAAAQWMKNKINFLDTPGQNIFINETHATMVAAETALIVVDATSGVEVQTAKVWDFAAGYKQPRAIVINKLDRERASFEDALETIHERFGRAAVPIQLPIGSERGFQGVIDLIGMRAYTYTLDGDGNGREGDIPAVYAEAAKVAHEVLVEMVAEGKDDLLEEFFEQGTLPVEHILEGLNLAFRELRLFPVLCTSGLHNIGSDRLLNFIGGSCLSPLERPPLQGSVLDLPTERKIAPCGPASAQVFKTLADPFSGRISYFKIISGILKNDAHVFNVRNGSEERLAHIGVPLGKAIIPVAELQAGDIGVVAKLKDTITGDTLGDKHSLIAYDFMRLPQPSLAFAIEAKSRNDEDRMGQALHKLMEEDLCLRFYRDEQTKEFLLAGCGQQHVEIAVSRLHKRFHIDVTLKPPRIPYRETIRGIAAVQGRHKKQTGGHGQFGDCWIRLEPLPRGTGFQFHNETFGGSIPKNFIPAVEKGIVEISDKGHLAGYPMIDFRATVYDGSYHDVDSSELAFKLAARKAFRNAMTMAKPSILEPVMRVEIQAPHEYAGELMGDLNSRRARIAGGASEKIDSHMIRAWVPLSEMLTYQNDLTSMTHGRASYTMEFDHYDFVPGPQSDKIIAAAKIKGFAESDEDS